MYVTCITNRFRDRKVAAIIQLDKPEDMTLCLDVGQRELDLPVNTPGPN